MGTFTIGEKKIRPGIYHRTENAGGIELAGARNGIIAGVIRANWGPLNTVVTFDPDTSVKQVYGAGSGMTQSMIDMMFREGATKGYFVRAGSGGTAGSITLTDTTADTALNAVTLTAKYVGSRAFAVTIRDSLTNTEQRECIVYDGTTEFEKVTFAKKPTGGEAAALVAAFAESENFTATKVADGNGILAAVTQAAFTAGTDPTVDSEAYSAAMNALEPYPFNVMCVDSEAAAVHALVHAFIDRIYAAGLYPMAVLSTSKSQENTLAVRLAAARTYNDAKIVYVLNSAYDQTGAIVPGYLNAARIGGIIAAIPANQGITHHVISGYAKPEESLTNTQIETALKSGCIVLDVNASGQVWIEQGINTLITPSGNEDNGWKKIRRVKTRFELMQRIDDTLEPVIGKIDNDPDGRAAVVAAGQSIINLMAYEKKLLPGGVFAEDENNPPQGDSAWFIIAVDDIDSLEKIYLTYRFRFSPTS